MRRGFESETKELTKVSEAMRYRHVAFSSVQWKHLMEWPARRSASGFGAKIKEGEVKWGCPFCYQRCYFLLERMWALETTVEIYHCCSKQ